MIFLVSDEAAKRAWHYKPEMLARFREIRDALQQPPRSIASKRDYLDFVETWFGRAETHDQHSAVRCFLAATRNGTMFGVTQDEIYKLAEAAQNRISECERGKYEAMKTLAYSEPAGSA
jgi:hypothetical protein